MKTQPRPITITHLTLIAAAVLALFAVAASEASGSTYTVRECFANPYPFGATPDLSKDENTGSYPGTNTCTSGAFLEVVAAAGTNSGRYTTFQYDAPLGTRIDDLAFNYSYFQDDASRGNRPTMFIKRVGAAQQTILTANTDGPGAGNYSTLANPPAGGGPYERVGFGIYCGKPAGVDCQGSNQTHIRMTQNSFYMRDVTSPQPPAIGGSLFSGWVDDGGNIETVHTDIGAGVRAASISAIGTGTLAIRGYCDSGATGDGSVGSMAPCPRNVSDSIGVNASSLQQGTNTIRVCTVEYGEGPAQTCSDLNAHIDTIAPAAPSGLTVAGGEGWKRDNDFDLTWTNPPQPHAPITEARVRITGPGGYNQTFGTSGVQSAGDIELPNVGAYTAHVYLIDAAGNANPNAAATAMLRFDDTVPAKSAPSEANGWINRRDLEAGYEQIWDRPPSIPPSGIDGYRFTVSGGSDSDPCGGATDARVCSGPLTHEGIDSRRQTLTSSDLAEGSNWAHVVGVSGSGMRATEIGHTEIKVDTQDPVAALSGTSSGWVNVTVRLEATASDTRSGMADSNDYPDDPPPATFLRIDDRPAESNEGPKVSTLLVDEGVHQAQFWARDLAGNENDGNAGNNPPSVDTVRIDKTAPSAAFANRQDPDDPDRLVAKVTDQLSGVASGEISFRSEGAEWRRLETELLDGRLVARVDSEQMKEGVTYEFRVRADDRAGNSFSSTLRENGEPMTRVGPFRTPTRVVGLGVSGKPKVRLRYGARPVISGRLVDASGEPVRGTVEVTEAFAEGSAAPDRNGKTQVQSGGDGRFEAKLAAGPSRSVSAVYRGDRRFLGAEAGPVVANVRGKVALRLSAKQVRAGGKVRFNGRIKAAGARIPKAGKRLEIQVRLPDGWKAVGRSFTSNKRGRFSLGYGFGDFYTEPTRFVFRAVVLRERGWPYLPAKSKKRSLTVLPH